MRLRTMLSLLGALALTAGVAADHVPGHQTCDPTFPMPIPGSEFFTGGVLFVTLIGPVEDTVITNTVFHIHYVSDGATPASDLALVVSVMVDKGSPEIIVTGADLGFRGGAGTFLGTFETDAFNGVVWQSRFPHSMVDLQIDAVGGGGIQGTAHFVASEITFDVIPPSECCPWDLDGDGAVGTADLLDLLGQWGTNPGGPPDLDGDGNVSTADLLTLLANWGACE